MVGPNIKRLYFSASDVCRMAGIGPGTLKGWELKFTSLKPARSQTGRRLYKPSDLTLVKRIKRLKDIGYTDEKVAEMLLSHHEHEMPPMLSELSEPVFEPAVPEKPSPDLLSAVKHDLKEILDLLSAGMDEHRHDTDEQRLL